MVALKAMVSWAEGEELQCWIRVRARCLQHLDLLKSSLKACGMGRAGRPEGPGILSPKGKKNLSSEYCPVKEEGGLCRGQNWAGREESKFLLILKNFKQDPNCPLMRQTICFLVNFITDHPASPEGFSVLGGGGGRDVSPYLLAKH
jgi:hypothetical protein